MENNRRALKTREREREAQVGDTYYEMGGTRIEMEKTRTNTGVKEAVHRSQQTQSKERNIIIITITTYRYIRQERERNKGRLLFGFMTERIARKLGQKRREKRNEGHVVVALRSTTIQYNLLLANKRRRS